MAEPPDRPHSRRTEPIPPAGGPAPRRDPTEPLQASSPGGGAGARRLPTRWVVVGLIAVAAVFLMGFLAGRGGRAEPAGEGRTGGACRRAANVSARLVQVHRRALANRVQFVEAAVRNREERMAELDGELEALSRRGERLEERGERVLERCRS